MKEIYRLFSELEQHLLKDKIPSEYLKKLYDHPLLTTPPFDMIYKLKHTPQSPEHHPEGNVWNHTLLVTDEAAKMKYYSKNEKVFMWAAFLHDIGKPPTTKLRKGRITAYDHDKVGAKMTKEFLSHFIEDKKFIEEVSMLVYYHMHILYVLKRLRYADIKGMKKKTDVKEVALLGFCDRLGRKNVDRKKEELNIKCFRYMSE